MEHIRNEISGVLDRMGIERKAIRTTYNGVHYRSRLEARWSIFLDYLGVEHVYEFEGFELPSSRYLPDFWMPALGWLEIKPTDPSQMERRLCEELAGATNSRVYLASGLPQDHGGIEVFAWDDDGSVWTDDPYAFCQCQRCHRIGVEFSGWSERLCDCFPGTKGGPGERVIGAVQAARLASFWDPRN